MMDGLISSKKNKKLFRIRKFIIFSKSSFFEKKKVFGKYWNNILKLFHNFYQKNCNKIYYISILRILFFSKNSFWKSL